MGGASAFASGVPASDMIAPPQPKNIEPNATFAAFLKASLRVKASMPRSCSRSGVRTIGMMCTGLYCSGVQSAERRIGEVPRDRLEQAAARVVDTEDEPEIVRERFHAGQDPREAFLREIAPDEIFGQHRDAGAGEGALP